MKTRLASLVSFVGGVALLAGVESALAQRAAPVVVRSPEMADDGRVTFRLRAPKAAEVKLVGQWSGGRATMTKDSNQVWAVTLGPVPAGVWEYSFSVDGLMMIDPLNTVVKPQREPRVSILHVPAKPPAIHDRQEVPHGAVRTQIYTSKSLGRVRPITIYTPPGYDQKTTETFPVLYLQHGMTDNQDSWTVHGKAHWILDNLIAAGRAKPMIIVMLDGHAYLEDVGPNGFVQNAAQLERDMLEDAMPFVEANFRVKPGAENRAIVGLSMGGGHSLAIGLRHTDKFAWIGAFSAATPPPAFIGSTLTDSKVANQRLKLLWIGIGKDDFLLNMNNAFQGALKEKDVRHEWHLTDGDHSWPVWRRYLADIAPKLFQ